MRTLVISSGLRIQIGFCLFTSPHSWATSFTVLVFFGFSASSSSFTCPAPKLPVSAQPIISVMAAAQQPLTIDRDLSTWCA